ncbi:MAG: MYXO-CTERM sorting domain-containing protein, partial [Kofleriaceae bacterium]
GSYTLTATFTCTDSDLDGACDGADGCPQDPEKVEPGACGCGVVDDPTDGDGDGTADCSDGCPLDPDKAAPGTCGCGVVESDGDGDADGDADGVIDCFDQCPWSAHKSEPGVCGCGAEDLDTDGDGSVDCPVPAPPEPTTAGCQASSGGSLAIGWLVLGLVLVLVRRRRVR